MSVHEKELGVGQNPDYDANIYLRLADAVACLVEGECHSEFYAEKAYIVGRLWEAAVAPNDPRSRHLLNALPLFVYIPLELPDSNTRH